MITFACQDIEFSDLLRCSFALNKTEYNVMMYLLKNDIEYSATDLGKAMKFDRTTVQKALKKLSEKDLVFRHQKNLTKGGYTFNYSIKNKNEIKQRMINLVDKWHEGGLKEIKNW